MNEEHTPIMLSLKEASEKSGLSYSALRLMCIRNEIVHIRVGRKYLINWARLVEYLGGSASVEITEGVACQS